MISQTYLRVCSVASNKREQRLNGSNGTMAFTSNIKAFGNLGQPNALVNAYRLLVAVELALKDAGWTNPTAGGGHDVPQMLQIAAYSASAPGPLSAKLIVLVNSLRRDLGKITCQGIDNRPKAARPHAYPDIRYGRHSGDWAGASETPDQHFADLELTCRDLCNVLSQHGTQIGIHL